MNLFSVIYNEIISKNEYEKILDTDIDLDLKKESYKKALKILHQKIFKGKRMLVYDFKTEQKVKLSNNDKNTILLLNDLLEYTTTENYILGQTNNGKSILNVLSNLENQLESINKKKEIIEKNENPQVVEKIKEVVKQIETFQKKDGTKLLKSYKKNKTQSKELKIVFTWVPRKIASMSTKTGWSSCMNLDSGINKHMVPTMIENGTFIAWLVREGDEFKLDKPVARVLCKVYKNSKGDLYWKASGTSYGTVPGGKSNNVSFEKSVNDILFKLQEPFSSGEYDFVKTQYKDSGDQDNVIVSYDKETWKHHFILPESLKDHGFKSFPKSIKKIKGDLIIDFTDVDKNEHVTDYPLPENLIIEKDFKISDCNGETIKIPEGLKSRYIFIDRSRNVNIEFPKNFKTNEINFDGVNINNDVSIEENCVKKITIDNDYGNNKITFSKINCDLFTFSDDPKKIKLPENPGIKKLLFQIAEGSNLDYNLPNSTIELKYCGALKGLLTCKDLIINADGDSYHDVNLPKKIQVDNIYVSGYYFLLHNNIIFKKLVWKIKDVIYLKKSRFVSESEMRNVIKLLELYRAETDQNFEIKIMGAKK